ncbi:unnamed protein product, partial [Effrenium voratum]
MAGPAGDVRTMSPQEAAQWCNSLALCGVKGKILRDLQEQIVKKQIDGLQLDRMLRSNTLTDLGIEELNARLALSIRRSWTTDFNGVTFINYAASQAHFQGRELPGPAPAGAREDPRRQKRDFFNQVDPEPEYGRGYGVPPRRDMPWSPSMGGPPAPRDMVGMRDRDPRLEDPYAGMDRVPPPYPGDRERGYEDFYDRGPPADRRAHRGPPDALDWNRGPQIQIPPSPGADPYGGYDAGYPDPGYDDAYDRAPGHMRDDPGRGFGGYPDRGPAFSPEDDRYDRMRRSPGGGGDPWGGVGLDQALPKRGPAPNNVARIYAEERPAPSLRSPGAGPPQSPQRYEPQMMEPDYGYDPPPSTTSSKGGRANVRDPNAGSLGGLFGSEPRDPPPRR